MYRRLSLALLGSVCLFLLGTSLSFALPAPPLQKLSNKLYAVSAASMDNAWAIGHADSGGETCTICKPLIEHWDGKSWQIVDFPVQKDVVLYGVTAIGDSAAWFVGMKNAQPLIAYWNGKSWEPMSSPTLPSPDGYGSSLNALTALSPTNAWAVGKTERKPLIEHWDGKSWQVVDVPDPESALGYVSGYRPLFFELTSITAIRANDIYASGPTLLEHWDGKSWQIVPRPSIGAASSSALSNRDLWTAGEVYEPAVNTMAHWNGTHWRFFGLPYQGEQNHYLRSITEVHTNDVWTVGTAEFASYEDTGVNTRHLALVGHWNGKEWQRLTVPEPSKSDNNLYSVSATCSDDAWAVGYTSDLVALQQAGPAHTFILHWDGKTWRVVPSPNL